MSFAMKGESNGKDVSFAVEKNIQQENLGIINRVFSLIHTDRKENDATNNAFLRKESVYRATLQQ
jgi:hypothetical protein